MCKINKKYKIKDTDFVIGSVGRIAPEKSFDKLISTMTTLVKENKNIKRARNINRKDCRFYGKLYAGSYRDRFKHGGQTEKHKRRSAFSVPPAKDENNGVLPRL